VKKRTMFNFIWIVIALLTIFTVIRAFHVFESDIYVAKNGQMLLQNWDSQEYKTIRLNGEWEFYPGQLIVPNSSEDVFEQYNDIQQWIQVPGAWDRSLTELPTPYGVGTYRLKIFVPDDARYGLKINTIRNANTVYINGVKLGTAGIPSDNKEEYRFDYKKYVVLENSKNRQLDLVILVANKDYAIGGIVSPIDFGLFDQILAKQGRSKFIEAFLIAGYLLFSFIYFTTHIQRQRMNRYELYFSLFCLAQAIHISTVNERWLYLLFPEIKPATQLEIQAIALSSMVLFFLLFVYRFFSPPISRWIFRSVSIALAIQVTVILLFSASGYLFRFVPVPILQLVISITVSIGYLLVFVMMLRVCRQKRDEAEYVLTAVAAFASYGLLLLIVLIFDVDIETPSLILFLIMVMSLSMLMSYRSQQAFKRVEELSDELLLYDRLKDEFLAKTSHELATPLHGIINLSQSLIEGIEGPLRKEQQESVILINTVGRRLASLVEELLFVSQIKKEELILVSTPIHIRIVEDVINEIIHIMPRGQNVQLINNITSDLPLIYMDEQKLKQVFLNLLYNAIKYTANGTITISAEVIDEYIQVSVEDTGVGIGTEHFDLIFTTFYQIESSRSGKSGGLGLGLSITQKIVEAAGGEIWVTSELNKGSRFTFTVPLATDQQLLNCVGFEQQDNVEMIIAEPMKQIFPELNRLIKGTKSFTVLVVDDEPANLKVLINVVHSLEYTVIAVSSGQEALEVLQNHKIDLLILDLMMPNMTGYEVCKIVRQEYDLVELPVIILTAAGQLTDLMISFQLGANDYLQKPVVLDELGARIESLLLIKKSAQEAFENEMSHFYTQITPHFLYNTLNTIIGLSYIDEEKTREALEHLATYFRAKLNFRKQRSLVLLEEEIDLVKAYLAIEKMRFEERLHVEYYIDETIEMYIPTMSLQPLVENAVQHGISQNKDGGTLRLTIERENQYIKIMIEDDGVGISEENQQELLRGKNERIGFNNPFKKLSLIKGTSFELESEEGKGTLITIRLPEMKNKVEL